MSILSEKFKKSFHEKFIYLKWQEIILVIFGRSLNVNLKIFVDISGKDFNSEGRRQSTAWTSRSELEWATKPAQMNNS